MERSQPPPAPVLVGHAALQQYTAAVVRATGADSEVAAEVARHLVGANLAGHDSHGVLRLPQYVDQVDEGLLHSAARPRVIAERGAVAVLDAGRGYGAFSTMQANEWVIRTAPVSGIAAVAVRHSMHIGRLGEYTERITGEGLVGIATVGIAGAGSATVAPFGGGSRFLGTNPWSMGVPAAGRPPMIFDAATSTIAEGKVRMAMARGVEVPEGTLRDAAGNPTLDPAQLYEGGTQTVVGGAVAGHKGYGFSLAAALIGGLAMVGDEDPTPAGTMHAAPQWGTRIAGAFVVAIDPSAFGEALLYQRMVAEVLAAATEVTPVPGVDRVLVPGDAERASRVVRERDGIPIPRPIHDQLVALADRFGVARPG